MSERESEWISKGRPQSTMAQAFSHALDSAFMLDSDLDHLAQSIQQKKQMVTIQARELEALQAKIREAEERLKQKDLHLASASGSSGRNSPDDRPLAREGHRGGAEEGNTARASDAPSSST